MKAVTYARVSSDDQVRGMSLPTQEERCAAFVAREGWELVAHFSDDGVSASKVAPEDRPAFSQILDLAKRGEIDVIVGYAQDRVSRNKVHWFTLEAALKVLRVHLVTVTGSTDTRNEDSLPSDIDALLAEREARKISERTMRGKVAFARAGAYVGGPPPFGYRVVREERRSVLAVDPDEAQVVLRAAALLVDEKRRPHEVANALNAAGFRTRGGPNRSRPVLWTGTRCGGCCRTRH
jgi:DNA invertase Pin-like site-specific DNA recombinase